jgi:transcriptional regulator with XRE-family HTH domain
MADSGEAHTLGDYVRQARLAKALSLRDLAAKLDLAPSYLSDIENDRRVPSEEVLRRLSTELELDFDQLMAFAGRFGDRADRYLKRNPTAGRLFRRLSEANLGEQELKKLLHQADLLRKKREASS